MVEDGKLVLRQVSGAGASAANFSFASCFRFEVVESFFGFGVGASGFPSRFNIDLLVALFFSYRTGKEVFESDVSFEPFEAVR